MSLPTDTLIFDAHGRGVDLDAIVTALDVATTALGRPPVGGKVSTLGAVLDGTGFTVEAHVADSGAYALTWATPFAAAPAILVTPAPAAGSSIKSATAQSTTAGATVFIVDADEVPLDSAFSFVAVGS